MQLKDQAGVGLLIIAARIGVSGDGKLTEKEKRLVDAVFGGIVNSIESFYEEVVKPVGDETYSIFKNIYHLLDSLMLFVFFILNLLFLYQLLRCLHGLLEVLL